MGDTGFPYDETPTGFFYFASQEGVDNGFGRDIHRAEEKIARHQYQDDSGEDEAVCCSFVVHCFFFCTTEYTEFHGVLGSPSQEGEGCVLEYIHLICLIIYVGAF